MCPRCGNVVEKTISEDEDPFPVEFPDGSVWLVHTPRCKSCAAMELVVRFREHPHKDQKAADPKFRTQAMYADGRFSWVEPLPDDFDWDHFHNGLKQPTEE